MRPRKHPHGKELLRPTNGQGQAKARTVRTMSPAGDLSTGFAIQRAAAATSVLRLYCAAILARPSAGML